MEQERTLDWPPNGVNKRIRKLQRYDFRREVALSPGESQEQLREGRRGLLTTHYFLVFLWGKFLFALANLLTFFISPFSLPILIISPCNLLFHRQTRNYFSVYRDSKIKCNLLKYERWSGKKIMGQGEICSLLLDIKTESAVSRKKFGTNYMRSQCSPVRFAAW